MTMKRQETARKKRQETARKKTQKTHLKVNYNLIIPWNHENSRGCTTLGENGEASAESSTALNSPDEEVPVKEEDIAEHGEREEESPASPSDGEKEGAVTSDAEKNKECEKEKKELEKAEEKIAEAQEELNAKEIEEESAEVTALKERADEIAQAESEEAEDEHISEEN
ncbi:hypothetical protein cyc_07283 [Cyclospora cayetanensis]|uniref:Uncharacterized protein n=1 Tax=Cyclospora cayetanensis TaxID=88456 RepID=A0A1D3CZY7_9EIME|nr:hypothetical protein cyc_07283 [Cyclospora cayetanensis]